MSEAGLPRAEKIGQIEAVAEADGHDQRIDGDVGLDAGIFPRRVGIFPDLLDVGVEVPAFADLDVDAGLQGEAPGVVETDLGAAEIAVAAIEVVNILNAGADVGFKSR